MSKQTKLAKANKKNIFINFLILILIIQTFVTSFLIYERNSFTPVDSDYLKIKQEILNIIEKDSLYQFSGQEQVSKSQLKGLVQGLKDPYSEYLDQDESQEFNDALNQRYEGVGIRFDDSSGEIIVDRIFRESPAQESGVMVGDKLLSVDDQSVENMELSEVAKKIRGPENSQVKLSFERDGQTLEKNITRKKIQTDLVYFEQIREFGIIEISSFGNGVSLRLEEISKQILSNNNFKHLILDLRGNSGGLLEESIEVLSYFTEPNLTAVIEKQKDSELVIRTRFKENRLIDLPVTVLVDQHSASASEILAGALRDLRQAKLVGRTTVGKGVVQRFYTLSNNDQIKITIAEWLTPNRTEINKIGLKPDIWVNPGEDIKQVALQEISK